MSSSVTVELVGERTREVDPDGRTVEFQTFLHPLPDESG
jgi:hypothetical protein